MCQTAILPTVLSSENANTALMQVTYVLNRWLKMLANYGKLDASSLCSDVEIISSFIGSTQVVDNIWRALVNCRYYAITKSGSVLSFLDQIEKTLKLLCRKQDCYEIRKIKKNRADQGMTERYRPLTKRLEKEKIRKLNKHLAYVDLDFDDSYDVKLIRRIVEKRAAQDVHRWKNSKSKDSNEFRQRVRRATSFSLYQTSFTDYDARKRAPGTHWRVIRRTKKGKVILKSKKGFYSYQDALDACNRYVLRHPDDPIPMSAYKCEFCGKWHIGHDRKSKTQDYILVDSVAEAS